MSKQVSLANLKHDLNEPPTPASVTVNSTDFGTFIPRGTKFDNHKWLQLTHDPFVIQSVSGVRVRLRGGTHTV